MQKYFLSVNILSAPYKNVPLGNQFEKKIKFAYVQKETFYRLRINFEIPFFQFTKFTLFYRLEN